MSMKESHKIKFISIYYNLIKWWGIFK